MRAQGVGNAAGDEGTAAWCSTNSMPRTAVRHVSRSVIEPSIRSIRCFSGARLALLPVEKSSSTDTDSPRPHKASARLEPMKPPPPVIRYRAMLRPFKPTGEFYLPEAAELQQVEPFEAFARAGTECYDKRPC